MPNNIPDYEKEFVVSIRKNLNEVLELLKSKDAGLVQKMRTFSSRFNFVIGEVEAKIKKDLMFRAFFTKDPAKQKIHENIAARFIESLPNVHNFRQLGHAELLVLRGGILTRKEYKKSGATSKAKTIDFCWETNKKIVYASHKYTRASGGGQDNQYFDLQEFIREANESNLPKTYFLAIADGDYYKMKDATAGVSKSERLKRLANRRSVFSLSIGELERWLGRI